MYQPQTDGQTVQSTSADGEDFPAQMLYESQVEAQESLSNGSGGPCCGCLPLKTGCIVIGVVSILRALIYIGGFAYALVVFNTRPIYSQSYFYKSLKRESVLGFENPPWISTSVDARNNIAVTGVIFMLLFLGTSVALIIGAVSKNQTSCLAWLIGTIFSVIGQLFKGLIIFQWEFALMGIFLFLDIYFIVVVVYYILELEDEKRPQEQEQFFMQPTQEPLMIPQYSSYDNGNAAFGYSQSQDLMQQNSSTGAGYPSQR